MGGRNHPDESVPVDGDDGVVMCIMGALVEEHGRAVYRAGSMVKCRNVMVDSLLSLNRIHVIQRQLEVLMIA